MILVTTPTGNTGSQVLQQLVTAGQPVRALVRNPAKLPVKLREQIHVVQGSLLDADTFARALDGCSAFYFCIPQADDASDVIEHYEAFVHVALRAAQQSGTQRVVFLSGAGKASPLADHAGAAAALFHAEDLLAHSGLAMRALRCPVFFESTLWQIAPIKHAGMLFGLLPGDYRHGQVAARDIAAAATHYLTDTTWNDVQGVGVFGPADISQDEIAAWIADAIKKPVRYQQISRERYVANLHQFGVSDALANAVAGMFEAIASGLFSAEPRSLQPTPTITMQHWIADVFVPAFEHPDQY